MVTVTLLSVLCALSPASATDALRSGDLIFLDLDCGELCDAIETVTKEQFKAPSAPNFSHVAILFQEKDAHGHTNWMVYEAWEKVQKTPLQEVLQRVNHDPARYRFKRFEGLTTRKAKQLRKSLDAKLSLPYDNDFLINNGKFYCSELVADSFNEVFKAKPFEYQPMHFGTPNDKNWKIWENYYRKLDRNIPTAELGISPLGIFMDTKHLNDIAPPIEPGL